MTGDGKDEERICRGCPLLKTKPETVPQELIGLVAIATNLSEVERIGGRFDYPDGLTILEWECLRAISRGRDRAEGLRQKRDRKKR